ncbi:putative bifunctional diguanylate cyclase/phosphodiesterase [[Erwinia] mediterraneensis]|uniref:putative bifunctional diguanylate cyclase/phosphodiesterase n=1 Tax=[Erwinia] mediterraneensis TaxID=2161819 RepID=UPI002351F21F|nr:EAL domain-containing protein [[Erwinia] mediterraneensis]
MKESILRKTFGFPESEYRSTTKVVKRALWCMTALLALLLITTIIALTALAKNLNQTSAQENHQLLQKALDDRMHRLVWQVKNEAVQNEIVSLVSDKAAAQHLRAVRDLLRADADGPEGLFVTDEQGHTLYGLSEGQPASQSLQQWLGSGDFNASQQGLTRTLIAVNGYPALVASLSFSAEREGIPGPTLHLVMVDKIGPAELRQTGEAYGIRQLSVVPAHHQAHQATFTLPLHNGTLMLQWENHRPGDKILLYILPLLIVPGLFTAILALYLMRSALSKARLYDVLEQNRLALSVSERRFRDVAEATSDWIWEIDRDLNITWLSERFPGITGHRISAWLGKPITGFIKTEKHSLETWITETGSAGHRRLLHCHYFSAQGHLRYCHIALKPIDTEEGVTGYRGTATDVTLEVEAQARVQYLSLHDELTGLPNRTRMREFLDGKLQALPDTNHPLAMISLGLDKFKPVNDLFGHTAGDAVLHEVSTRLRRCLRDYDLVARQGGDEFILIMPSIARQEDIEKLCARILSELRQPFYIHDHEMFIGASMGIAFAPQDALEAGELLRLSNIALYEAKNAGRNGWKFYTPEMEQHIVQRREMENSLREAIKLQQFRLVYQPRYSLDTGKIVAAEALIRWQHPHLGLIMPDQFIMLAEETGLITSISEWVLKSACHDAAQWPDGLAVSVNISAVEFESETLLTRVKAALDESRLAANRLEIEITESAAFRQPKQSLILMKGLKKLGVRLLMDDFGTGYSSLSYLRNYPFDGIKLDKTFIDAMPASEDANAIVENIIGLGKIFSMSITAEGVETQAQRQKLKALGCDEIQGYLMGRPLALAEFRKQLALSEGVYG